ncbi:MAG: lipid A biosynthesis acyltransferase [Chromatiales bacterium]|nr:lipid A biosynthesis acyltransferase [Chromatiales bacterium]
MVSHTDTDASQPLTRFWQPRYWPVWFGLGLLRMASLLPARRQLALGRGLGWLVYRLVPERRRVAAINLALCFPERPATERDRILRGHFASLGMTLMEHGLTWWASDALVRELVEVRGAEHLRAAVASGRGIILLTGHFGAQEFTGRAFRLITPTIAALYRPTRNAFVDEVLRRIRARGADVLIPKQSMRRMIRALRQGLPVWYAPDQSHRRAWSALIPFLGEPAMTTTALSEVARLGNALVLPVLPRRFPATGRYTLEIRPPLADFPGATPEDDAVRVNALLEQHIREAPEQYYWIHRRFKGRPPPFPDPYEAKA